MSEKDEKDFKVVDRRAASGAQDATQGESFTMKATESAAGPTRIDFSTLTLSLATSALINLGVAPDPVTKKTVKNLETAKQNIDILTLLKDKTKGNLDTDETQLLESLITEVKLRFVEASR